MPQWLGYMYLAKAILAPAAAWEDVCSLSIFDSGNSKTNALYWIATRPVPEQPYNMTAFAAAAQLAATRVPASCLANTGCFAQGLTLDCCPTDSGVMLGCCPVLAPTGDALAAAACSAHPRCIAAGLAEEEGALCCPAPSGAMLACCEDHPPAAVTAPPVDPKSPALCGSNKGCEDLEGLCCPTAEGVFLGCCGPQLMPGVQAPQGTSDSSAGGKTASTVSTADTSTGAPAAVEPTSDGAAGEEHGEFAACSSHPQCVDLKGDCCPTAEGMYLGCCGDA